MTKPPRDYRTAHLLPLFQEPAFADPEDVREVQRDAGSPTARPASRPRKPPRPSVSGDDRAVTDYLKWYRAEGYRHKFREKKPDYPTY